ncbi:hypothetical protein U1Q18_051719 [Sarracenia purpurea var. burkii]
MVIFLKYAHDLDPNQQRRFEEEHPHIVEAIETLRKFRLSQEEYEMSLDDTENMIIEALRNGKAEGLAKEKRNEKLI